MWSGVLTIRSVWTLHHLPRIISRLIVSPPMPPTSKELGDAGEIYACELLHAHGYIANLLPVNAKTYDIHVDHYGREFLVSVKVSRDKQHVRLGARKSVRGLVPGNFVFAFMPTVGGCIRDLKKDPYTLLIIPADVARSDALSIHDPYWLEKDKDPNTFSVMVKGYGSHHRDLWPRWLQFKDAWHFLP